MQKCYETYICGAYHDNKQQIQVLDIGGANVNGSYSDIYSQEKFNYIAVDIAPGDGVDLVLEDPYRIPYEDASVDVLISGQAFEHVEFFWLLFEEMVRVVREDGWIILIAPSAGPIHRYPVDCYRFYPDAYHALAKYADIKVVDIIHDPRGPWQDLVGVFSKAMHVTKPERKIWRHLKDHEINRYIKNKLPANTKVEERSPEIEAKRGVEHYLKTLKYIHQEIKPTNYLEIGVRQGNSLKLSQCPTIAVDPDPDFDLGRFENTDFFESTSDFFFENNEDAINNQGIHLAFIDGMHLCEFVLRDFINIEAHSNENTMVVIDDIFPNHEVQADRERKSRVWTGDVWKMLLCFKRFRADLKLTMLDTAPTGLLIVTGLNSMNKYLVNQYNPIVNQLKAMDISDYSGLILGRQEAISPLSDQFLEFIRDRSQTRNLQR